MMRDGDLAIGVDVGGTKVAAGLVALRDERAEVMLRARGPVDPATNAGGIASITAVIDEVVGGLDAGRRARVKGIGVACAGNVDHVAGTLRRAANMAWVDLGIADALRKRYGVGARVENDVNAAAWGLATIPRPDAMLPPNPTVAYLVVGTGIGAGVVDGGRILRGRVGSAGELGHLPGIAGAIDPAAGDVPCVCGALRRWRPDRPSARQRAPGWRRAVRRACYSPLAETHRASTQPRSRSPLRMGTRMRSTSWPERGASSPLPSPSRFGPTTLTVWSSEGESWRLATWWSMRSMRAWPR